MRLCIAMTGEERVRALQWSLHMGGMGWEVEHASDGEQALDRVSRARFDLLLLHGCLPKLDGYVALELLWRMELACPPRVLLLSEPELVRREGLRVDCVAPMLAAPAHLTKLLILLARKETPVLAEATKALRASLIEELLSALDLSFSLKGRDYIAWMLDKLIPSPFLENEVTTVLYPSCARALHSTPAAVERCVRHAVEKIFTRGSMEGIERYFGTTVDPERGKPTNRAFLIGAGEQLRARLESRSYSRSFSRSPMSMERRQRPAAPISV